MTIKDNIRRIQEEEVVRQTEQDRERVRFLNEVAKPVLIQINKELIEDKGNIVIEKFGISLEWRDGEGHLHTVKILALNDSRYTMGVQFSVYFGGKSNSFSSGTGWNQEMLVQEFSKIFANPLTNINTVSKVHISTRSR